MSRFTTFGLGHVEKTKIRNLDEKVTYVFRLFNFWNFFLPKFLSFVFFSFCSSDGPSTGLHVLAVKKLLRKHHRDGQFLPWSSQVLWHAILVWVFRLTFWAFLCVSQAPFSRSHWSGHHWKDLFLQQKLSMDDATFAKSDDVRSGRKAKARHGRLWEAQQSMG